MRKGFSLVELSIVLVILGLLTGGILTGQSLIRAAELRNVTTEFTNFQIAVNTFQDKYFQLPGDMSNATDFWGAAHATPATCITTSSTGKETCNGDGDGRIGDPDGVEEYERFRAWQHLANAGLIKGSYTGVAGSAGALDADVGVNVPRSKLTNAGWSIQYLDNADGSAVTDFPFSGNYSWFGAENIVGANNSPGTAVLTPTEARMIDNKKDDGRPGTGSVRTWRAASGVPNCSTTNGTLSGAADAAQAEYNLINNNVECSLQMDF